MARDPYPSESQDRFLLRMPDGMRDRLKAEAEANKRSMNAEIVARLEQSFGTADASAHQGYAFSPEEVEEIRKIIFGPKQDRYDKVVNYGKSKNYYLNSVDRFHASINERQRNNNLPEYTRKEAEEFLDVFYNLATRE